MYVHNLYPDGIFYLENTTHSSNPDIDVLVQDYSNSSALAM